MIHLLGQRLLVNVPNPIDQLPSGLFIPQTAQKPRNIGSVVAVGDSVNQWLIDKGTLKEGETLVDREIMFHIQSAQTFEYNDISLKLIFATDIIAIL